MPAKPSRTPARGRSRTRPLLEGTGSQHELVLADLQRRIKAGEYRSDQLLPGERELSTRYGVSRSTVRQALDRAERRGLVIKVPNRGTFVARPRVLQDLQRMDTFRQSVEAIALDPSYEILELRFAPASRLAAEHLGIRSRERILMVDSLGLGDGQPFALYQSHVAPFVAEPVQRDLADGKRSTYELAALALGVAALEVEQVLETTTVDTELAGLLRVPAGSSAFRSSSVYRTPQGERVEWRIAVYPGERFSFRARRTVEIS